MKLTENLSEELQYKGVNINAVLPSIVDTPYDRRDMPGADFSHWVSPEQLAEIICTVASRFASAVLGALIPVRGLT